MDSTEVRADSIQKSLPTLGFSRWIDELFDLEIISQFEELLVLVELLANRLDICF